MVKKFYYAVDNSGSKFLYEKYPTKSTYVWSAGAGNYSIPLTNTLLKDIEFPNITFEDDPIPVFLNIQLTY